MKLYRDFTSQEEIDLEYNMAITVPDTKRWMEKVYVQESAKVRHELKCELDVRFGPTVDERVDVFPAKEPGAALLVFIHGGYWNWGSSKEFSLVARGPVAHGVTVVVTNYSLCPKVTIAEITRQSRAVIAWLHRKASKFSKVPISTSRVRDRRYWSHSAERNQKSFTGNRPTILRRGVPTDSGENYSYRKPNIISPPSKA